ncbi:hypothetical protein GF319_05060 [Candidatus Bathyarchaeota archaeon]|nr:hypothetical protein [Candidatus Bathyarchaeota archaeon]
MRFHDGPGILIILFVFTVVVTLSYPLMLEKSQLPPRYKDSKENIQTINHTSTAGTLQLVTNKVVFEESIIGLHLVFLAYEANSSFFVVQVTGDNGLISRFQGFINEGMVPQFSFLSPSFKESEGIFVEYTLLPNWVEGPPYSNTWSIDRQDLVWRETRVDVINEYVYGDKAVKLYLMLLEAMWVLTITYWLMFLHKSSQ